jgi:ATP-binding cassette subfamily F protein uup
VNLVNLEDVSVVYGTAAVLDGVSLGLGEGERIGVVGRNGGGKTTLTRVITRAEEPQAGRVTHTGGLSIGWLPQHFDLDPTATVGHLVMGDRPEHTWAGDPHARAVLDGLALPPLDAVVGPMSGGERRRVALARVLLERHDLLILDEPTNHLDVEVIAWLAAHLAARREALLVVTHDRWFLDTVCTATWEVADGQVHRYDGGYSVFVLARAERARVAQVTESRRQNLMRKELAWLRRGPPARTSKPRFRIDAANALIADEPPARNSAELVRLGTARLGKAVYDVEDATVRLGDRTLIEHLTWHLGPGDRVGIVGANGSGKTTLLRLLTGEVTPTAGRVKRGLTVKAAYLDQEIGDLPKERRVLEAVEDIAKSVDLGNGKSMSASQLLERFLFEGERQWTPVGELSGGERRRLQLLRLFLLEPNVLLLDEPTNDLDIETLTALEDLLDGWPGTLVVVSHDRYFLERVCDTEWALLGDGALRHLPGGVDEYLERRRTATAAAPSAGVVSKAGGGDSRAAKKELTRLERALVKLDEREAALLAEMAAQAADYVAVQALDERLRAVREEKAAAEDAWLALSSD